MRFLLASSGLGAVAFVIASSASAATTVSTATTAPLVTSAAGDIQVTSAGPIKPAAGAAITINSNNKVQNDGTLAIQGVNGSAGITANPGLAGDIANSSTGVITVDENYTPTDTDSDGDIDGPFAQGNNRFGIHVLSGGTYAGNISNAGTITIEGNQSAGIAADSALTGSLTTTGKINVLGDNSVGIRAGAVSGNVTVGNASSTVCRPPTRSACSSAATSAVLWSSREPSVPPAIATPFPLPTRRSWTPTIYCKVALPWSWVEMLRMASCSTHGRRQMDRPAPMSTMMVSRTPQKRLQPLRALVQLRRWSSAPPRRASPSARLHLRRPVTAS